MKFRSTSSLLTTVLLLICIQASVQYFYNGYAVLDLQNTGTAFVDETTSWSATALVPGSPIYYNCGGDYVMGGYNVLQSTAIGTKNQYFQRLYTALPAHAVVRYAIRIFCIDSWDTNDGFQISFDNTVIDGPHIKLWSLPANICGNSYWPDANDMKIFGTVSHTRPSLTFRLISQFDQSSTDESVGFREISLLFASSPAATPNQLYVKPPTSLNSNSVLVNNGLLLPCAENQFMGKTACTSCSNGCSSCFGPADTDCFACKKPGYSWNGTQCMPCPTGCHSCTFTNNVASCLPCPINQIYYPEIKTCLDYCDYPMTLVDTDIALSCLYPCGPTEYLNGDQTCSSACPAPSIIVRYLNKYNLCTN